LSTFLRNGSVDHRRAAGSSYEEVHTTSESRGLATFDREAARLLSEADEPVHLLR